MIYFIMKSISKAETSTYSIAAAVSPFAITLRDNKDKTMFSNIHTTFLLNYLKYSSDDLQETLGGSMIVRLHNRTTVVVPFDDYASPLANLCLDKTADCHLNRRISVPLIVNLFGAEKTIQTLLGKLLLLQADSTDAAVGSEDFCLISTLFVP